MEIVEIISDLCDGYYNLFFGPKNNVRKFET